MEKNTNEKDYLMMKSQRRVKRVNTHKKLITFHKSYIFFVLLEFKKTYKYWDYLHDFVRYGDHHKIFAHIIPW